MAKAYVVHEFWDTNSFKLSQHFFAWATGDGALFSRFPEHTYHSWPNVVESLTLSLPVLLLSCSASAIDLVALPAPHVLVFAWVVWAVSVLTVDLLVDWVYGDRRHRTALLSSPDVNDGAAAIAKYSPLFILVAHAVANMYVVILEAGRLKGHIWNRRQWGHFGARFDWHCGAEAMLEAPGRFREMERKKAVGFGFAAAVVVAIVMAK